MKYHVSKLDSRFTGAQWFYCRVELMNLGNEDKALNFITLRNWCWETFGSSCEIDLIRKLHRVNPEDKGSHQWAWKHDDSSRRRSYYIYLTEPAYTAFNLKWAGQ